jgi:hypothetical protein
MNKYPKVGKIVPTKKVPKKLSSALASAVLLLFAPASAFSYELTTSVDATYVHDSNFFRTTNNEESADSVEPGVVLALAHKEGRLKYKASYDGSYQFYDEQDDADGPEHRVRLQGDYAYDQLTTIDFKNNFRDVRNQRFSRDDIRDGDTGQGARDNKFQRNDLEIGLHRDLSRTWEMELTAGHQFIDFNRNVNRSDSDSINLGASVLHRFAPRHRIGGGISWVNQDFDGDDFRLDAEAEYLIADVQWVFDLAQDVELIVNGGPAWIKTDEDARPNVQESQFVGGNVEDELFRANVLSCAYDALTSSGIASQCDANTAGAPPIPASDLGEVASYNIMYNAPVEDDDEVTFFGGAALQGRFSDWTVDAEVRRQQSAPSGDAIAAKLTQLRWEVGYTPAGNTWESYIAGSVERREAFSSSTEIDYTVVAGPEEAALRSQAFTRVRDSGDRRDAYTAVIGARKQFSGRLSAEASASFRRTERVVSDVETEVDSYFFVITMRYTFDPVRF